MYSYSVEILHYLLTVCIYIFVFLVVIHSTFCKICNEEIESCEYILSGLPRTKSIWDKSSLGEFCWSPLLLPFFFPWPSKRDLRKGFKTLSSLDNSVGLKWSHVTIKCSDKFFMHVCCAKECGRNDNFDKCEAITKTNRSFYNLLSRFLAMTGHASNYYCYLSLIMVVAVNDCFVQDFYRDKFIFGI